MPGPKPSVTPEQIAFYAESMCTQREIAYMLGVSESVIVKLLGRPAYRGAYERARENTRHKLRKKQIEAALDGDRTMLIWTGKQYLEQRDAPREVDINQNVQVTYIARWGGSGELPPADTTGLIEGELEEEE